MKISSEEKLLNILKEVNFLGTTDIEKRIKLSRRRVRQLIDSLYFQKKIRITGPGRNPLYYAIKENKHDSTTR
jgi:hypothetical protein